MSCERKTGLEFSYRKSRLTAVDDHYGSDTEDEDEDDKYQFHDQELEEQGIPPENLVPKRKGIPRPNLRKFLVRALFERDGVKFFHGTWLEEVISPSLSFSIPSKSY